MGLVKEARQGNQQAFSALLGACEHVITFHAQRLSPCEPEDLAQHLRMLVCDVGLRGFDGRASWVTYVSRICATRGRDWADRQVSGNPGQLEEIEAPSPSDVDDDDRRLLRRKMRRLSNLERAAVRGWSRGDDQRETAAKLGVGRSAVRDAVARAKKKLRK